LRPRDRFAAETYAWKASPNRFLSIEIDSYLKGDLIMATYIVLGNFTDQGIQSVKETTKRAEVFNEMARKAGVKVKEVYWTLGQFDLATIV
jgi:neutral trehalase